MAENNDKLIYDIVSDCYHEEQKTTTDLDSKAGSVTSIAGLLATLTAAVVGYMPKGPYQLLFVIPIILLIISAIVGLRALWIQSYTSIDPEEVIKRYHDKTSTETLRRYTTTISYNTMDNSRVNFRRAGQIKSAFTLLIVSISLFFVIVIINWIMR